MWSCSSFFRLNSRGYPSGWHISVDELQKRSAEDAFHNQGRPHSSLDWHTPNEAHEMTGEIKKHWHSWREDAIRRERAMAI